ncbi:MAG: DHH family phosphoesterase [Desulfomicrobium escambiense]|nr:DHH family phosphoesterase [Desulfomicrobium escambiense]
MIPPEELLNALRREDRFSIITHISPDGDGLGSALALAAALDQAGKETAVYCRDAVPQQYRFLPRWEAFRPMDDVTDFQTLVLVDRNDLDRIGIAKGQAGNITFRSSIVIDHHESERPFGDIRWIEPHAAATGMMIERLIPALGLTINRDMALSLYTAIIVDMEISATRTPRARC